MKKLILLGLALIGLVFVPNTKGQSVIFAPQNVCTAVSNQASTSVTNSQTIDTKKQKTVGVQITTAFGNGGTIPAGAMLYYFYRSADGSTYDTLPQIVGTAAQSTATNTFSTNIDSSGLGYLKLIMTNTIATTGILSTVVYDQKIGAAQ